MDIKLYTREVIQKNCELWNYAFFSNGDYNLNIIGIRNKDRVANTFNDYICLFYKVDGKWQERYYPATTDPGSYYLKDPMSKLGTAIMVPYQYRSTYKIDLHKGQYEALCQRKNIAVYRDNTKDNYLDLDPRTIEIGLFGVNIHRSSTTGTSTQVDKWSAGCNVIANIDNYNEFMSLCKKSSQLYGNSFTYTLFDERQLHI